MVEVSDTHAWRGLKSLGFAGFSGDSLRSWPLLYSSSRDYLGIFSRLPKQIQVIHYFFQE